MEMFQSYKYENIQDRLKRLAVANHPKKEKEAKNNEPRHNNIPSNRWRNSQGCQKHQQIQFKPPRVLQKEEQNLNEDRLKEFEKYSKETVTKEQQPAKLLSKVRSQNNFKIDQIIDSYNSYKQNKHKLLENLEKKYKIQPSEKQQKSLQTQIEDKEARRESLFPKHKKMQSLNFHADEMWKQNLSTEVQFIPKISRNTNKSTNFDEINDLLEMKQHKVSSDFIMKNISNQNIRGLISPRANRKPGKITKNIIQKPKMFNIESTQNQTIDNESSCFQTSRQSYLNY